MKDKTNCTFFSAVIFIYHKERMEFDHIYVIFLRCIKRMLMINEESVSEGLKDLYQKYLEKARHNFNEKHYAKLCEGELKALSKRGLREIFNNTIVKNEFMEKFGTVAHSLEFQTQYPIYGNFLKIELKRKLIEYEKKKQKVWENVPNIQSLLEEVCYLPELCAQAILWNFSIEELDKMMVQFLEIQTLEEYSNLYDAM